MAEVATALPALLATNLNVYIFAEVSVRIETGDAGGRG